jgi:hypothetical protein
LESNGPVLDYVAQEEFPTGFKVALRAFAPRAYGFTAYLSPLKIPLALALTFFWAWFL